MAKRVKRSQEFYRRALQGDKDNLGLRETARGFGSRDGFIIADLTPAQKRKITIGFHELQSLTAQPRYIYKAKSTSAKEKKKLLQAQKTVQEGTKTKWKVAFIPHVPRKLKSGKLSKPKIYFGKEGIKIRERGYIKISIPLDPVKLVKNSAKHIQDSIKAEAHRAQRFTIQAGANEMPVLNDRAGIVERVKSLMTKYDGRKAIPAGSGNAGDRPKSHKWNLWLHGLIAYEFPRVSSKAVSSAINEFDDARIALQKKRRAARAKAKYRAKR